MELVLISDGNAMHGSLLQRLPLFFSARLIDMKDLGPASIGPAKVVAVELAGATPVGLRRLSLALKHADEVDIICLVTKSERREVVQATSLGHVELFNKELGLRALVNQVRASLSAPQDEDQLAEAPVTSQAAFSNSTELLNELRLSAAIPSDVPMKVLNNTAEELSRAIVTDGLDGWMEAVKCHHSFTYRHSLHVAGLASAFAHVLGWPEEDCNLVTAGGLLHDIGKMRLPLSILDKPGRLSEEEAALVHKHPEFGREILKTQLHVSRELKKMAVQHHELLDGSGYPAGLSGDQIDTNVRLITICDIFSALTEKRAYKRALSPREAYGQLRAMGPKLDEHLVRKFRNVVLAGDLGDVKKDQTPHGLRGTALEVARD